MSDRILMRARRFYPDIPILAMWEDSSINNINNVGFSVEQQPTYKKVTHIYLQRIIGVDKYLAVPHTYPWDSSSYSRSASLPRVLSEAIAIVKLVLKDAKILSS